LTLAEYSRNPEKLRTGGLTVVLYEYEIQVFRY
jgi:hypothetical protein